MESLSYARPQIADVTHGHRYFDGIAKNIFVSDKGLRHSTILEDFYMINKKFKPSITNARSEY
ncbi:hypothetical protein EJB05_00353 [Eragrostis curvula]|uniref:Uncharacterized protein n=1 Tax=Eragrostis curvula TaxID=38414 RepID=A0A5J9WK40_9POAL|nr:hypothetical protein EJB05_00353 [Eragrostis curvula]